MRGVQIQQRTVLGGRRSISTVGQNFSSSRVSGVEDQENNISRGKSFLIPQDGEIADLAASHRGPVEGGGAARETGGFLYLWRLAAGES